MPVVLKENPRPFTPAIKLPSSDPTSHHCGTVWVLLTNATGDNNQCLALAELLDAPFTPIRIDWEASDVAHDRSISKHLLADTPEAEERRRAFGLRGPWPKIVIGSGRRSSRIGLWVKAQSAGRTKYIAIGRARARIHQYDLLIAPPQFALPSRPNIMHLCLPLTRSRIGVARDIGAIGDAVSVPKPWFSILVGGEAKEFITSERELIKAAQCAQAAANCHGGSVVVSSSRRTPAKVLAAIEAALDGHAYIYRWSGSKLERNPYRTLIERSSALFVTADSASMIADACASGTPTYIIEYPERRDVRRLWRRRLFHLVRTAIALSCWLDWRMAAKSLDRAQEWLHNSKMLRYPRDLRSLHASAYAMGLAQPLAAFRPDITPIHRKHACGPLARADVVALIARCRDLM